MYGTLLQVSPDPLYQSLLVRITSLSTLSGYYTDSIDFEVLASARKTLLNAILDAYEDILIILYKNLLTALPVDE